MNRSFRHLANSMRAGRGDKKPSRLDAPLQLELLETREVPSTLSIVPNATGAPTVYAVLVDHQVYRQAPAGYTLVAPGAVLDLQTIQDAANNPSVYVMGQDRQVYVHTPNGFGLTNPGVTREFRLTRNPSGTTIVYALGPDRQVYQQTTTGYVLAGLGQYLGIRATQDSGNNPALYAMGLDQRIYRHTSTGFVVAAQGQALDFQVTRDASGNPALFIIGLDRQVYHLTGGSYQVVAPGQALGLRAAQQPDGTPIAYILGLDQQIYVQRGATFSLTVPGAVLSFETSFTPTGNNLVFAIGKDHQVYTQTSNSYVLTKPGFVWTGPQSFALSAFEIIATGPGAGGGPNVKVFDAFTYAVKFSFFAYNSNFTGGVRVAVGDVNGDAMPDIVTAPGPGGGPDVHVYDGNTGELFRQFWAFDPRFTGGVQVTTGDVDGDGYDDIIVGADAGGGPNVTFYSGKDGSVLQNFMAFDPRFTGGVRVAAGDTNGNGYVDAIVSAGRGGGPSVAIFNGNDGTLQRAFSAAASSVNTGVHVAAGEANGDGYSDVITAIVGGDGPQVSVYSGLDGALLATRRIPFAGGGDARLAALDVTGDDLADIMLGAGAGTPPRVAIQDSATQQQLDEFFAYDPRFTGGIYVAAGQTGFAV